AGMLFAEVGIFVVIAVFMGILGDRELAAHQVAITLASTSFIVALGIGMATTVRVGHAIGKGDTRAARRSGLTAAGLGGVWMLTAAAVFLLIPEWLARIITDEPQVIAEAVPLLLVAAVFQLSDGTQVVMAGAL